jgi:hypothetical protein
MTRGRTSNMTSTTFSGSTRLIGGKTINLFKWCCLLESGSSGTTRRTANTLAKVSTASKLCRRDITSLFYSLKDTSTSVIKDKYCAFMYFARKKTIARLFCAPVSLQAVFYCMALCRGQLKLHFLYETIVTFCNQILRGNPVHLCSGLVTS